MQCPVAEAPGVVGSRKWMVPRSWMTSLAMRSVAVGTGGVGSRKGRAPRSGRTSRRHSHRARTAAARSATAAGQVATAARSVTAQPARHTPQSTRRSCTKRHSHEASQPQGTNKKTGSLRLPVFFMRRGRDSNSWYGITRTSV